MVVVCVVYVVVVVVVVFDVDNISDQVSHDCNGAIDFGFEIIPETCFTTIRKDDVSGVVFWVRLAVVVQDGDQLFSEDLTQS